MLTRMIASHFAVGLRQSAHPFSYLSWLENVVTKNRPCLARVLIKGVAVAQKR